MDRKKKQHPNVALNVAFMLSPFNAYTSIETVVYWLENQTPQPSNQNNA